jgi:hypothetical protein
VDKDCSDDNPCTIDSCNVGKCIHTPNPDICNDGLTCTDDICVPDSTQPNGYRCQNVFDPSNCGPIASCQEALCAPGRDCAIVSHDDRCPPSTITCLAPVCTNSGCGLRDTCTAADPNCRGCAQCSCLVTANKCVPSCPA